MHPLVYLAAFILAYFVSQKMSEKKELVSEIETLPDGSDLAPANPVDNLGLINEPSLALSQATKIDPVFGTQYDALIIESARSNNIEPELLYKLLYNESRFRPDIISGKTRSKKGAMGIAQFMPATAIEELGSELAALDPVKAVQGAARYLAKLIKSAGSVVGGVAAYNWGIGNVKRKGLDKAPQETVAYVLDITGEKIV